MFSKTLLAGLVATAAAEFEVDLRLLTANTTGNTTGTDAGNTTGGNGTTAPAAPTGNGTAPTAPAAPTGNNNASDYNKTTHVKVSVEIPQTIDLGLSNATTAQEAAALQVLCSNAAFAKAQKEGLVSTLSNLEGLLASHIGDLHCSQTTNVKAGARRLTAATGTKVFVGYTIEAPKTAKFAADLDAAKGTGESLEELITKEAVKKLVASAAAIAEFTATSLKNAAADPNFETALAAQIGATLAASMKAASAAATAAAITVDTDNVGGQSGDGKTVDKAAAVAHTSKITTTSTSTTSGAASTAVAALAALVAGALLF